MITPLLMALSTSAAYENSLNTPVFVAHQGNAGLIEWDASGSKFSLFKFINGLRVSLVTDTWGTAHWENTLCDQNTNCVNSRSVNGTDGSVITLAAGEVLYELVVLENTPKTTGFTIDTNSGEVNLVETSITGTPELTFPAPGTGLDGDTETFNWVGDADQYWLYAGSTQGSSDYFNSQNLGNTKTVIADGLPIDGSSTVHIRLWHKTGSGGWQYIDDTFIAGETQTTATFISAPTPGSILDGSTQTFTWQGVADEYWLYAGSTQGGGDYYNSLSLGTATTTTVSGLPFDGNSTVHLRLWHKSGSGSWQFIDETFIAGTIPDDPTLITTPVQGSVLDGATQTFTWQSNADEYWLYIGSTHGGNQHFNSGNLGTVNSYTSNNLPTDGSTVYIRLWYKTGSANWKHIDATFTAAPEYALIAYQLPDTDLDGNGTDWYQLQQLVNGVYVERCYTGMSDDCLVPAGDYQLINHSTGNVDYITIGGDTTVQRNIKEAFYNSEEESYLDNTSSLRNELISTDPDLVNDLGTTGDNAANDFDGWPYDSGSTDSNGDVGDGNFRVGCQWSHFSYDDPIVSGAPGGGGHLHMYWGNTNADYRTRTKESLTGFGGGTCNGFALNRSAYWMPALMKGEQEAVVPHEIIVYYKTKTVCKNRQANRVATNGHAACTVHRDTGLPISPSGISHTRNDVKEMPQGLQLISGNKVGVDLNQLIEDGAPRFGTTQDISEFVFWSCGLNGHVRQRFPRIPTTAEWNTHCQPFTVTENNVQVTKYPLLNATVYFPQCWVGPDVDGELGVNQLTSPDPFVWTHVTQVSTEQACPTTHPDRLPQLGFLVYWDIATLAHNTDQLYLSSDLLNDNNTAVANGNPGSTLHADWLAGWHNKTMETWINECLKKGRNCTFGQLSTQYELKTVPEHKYYGHDTADALRFNSTEDHFTIEVHGSGVHNSSH